jgi:hypothetical protein
MFTSISSTEMVATLRDGNASAAARVAAPGSDARALAGDPFFLHLDRITAGGQFGYVIEYAEWQRHGFCEDEPIPLMDAAGFVTRPVVGAATLGIACSNQDAVREFAIIFGSIGGVVLLCLVAAIGLCCSQCFRGAKSADRGGDAGGMAEQSE